ncbi:MAG: DUF1573 domain-containing protein [Niastella sp.]|nr:DUF1573 domain-containing protein [Niastella sp.]
MWKQLVFMTLTAGLLVSCDIRKHDQQANVGPQPATPVIRDSTTATVIDTAYNFGKATDGEIVEYNFRFTNSGKNPLIIIKATASCGCTIPEKPEQPILPGDTGFIKVKFDTQNRVGNAHKTITVISNANPAFPELSLTGEVIKKD